MRITKLSLIFLLIVIPFLMVQSAQLSILIEQRQEAIKHQRWVEEAVDAALFESVDANIRENPVLDREECVSRFFRSLWGNTGIVDETQRIQWRIKNIPMIALIEKEQMTVLYPVWEGEEYVWEWSDSIPYRFVCQNRIYYFTLSNDLRIELEDGNVVEGDYRDLQIQYPDELVLNHSFHRIRKTQIIRIITKSLEEYCESYNLMAKQNGDSYFIQLPYCEEDEWFRTIDDISFLALYTGNTGQYIFGGSRLKKGGR
ncbi:MAG: hypothetical protein ACI4CT_03565 [Lachnospiraceae bacterium]